MNVKTLESFPLPWVFKARGDGLVNIYSGITPIALCVRLDVAALILSAVEEYAEDLK